MAKVKQKKQKKRNQEGRTCVRMKASKISSLENVVQHMNTQADIDKKVSKTKAINKMLEDIADGKYDDLKVEQEPTENVATFTQYTIPAKEKARELGYSTLNQMLDDIFEIYSEAYISHTNVSEKLI